MRAIKKYTLIGTHIKIKASLVQTSIIRIVDFLEIIYLISIEFLKQVEYFAHTTAYILHSHGF